MVNRLQENEALIADLDGTLISRNSFTLFVKWLAGVLAGRGAAGALLRLAGIVALRKMRRMSHALSLIHI